MTSELYQISQFMKKHNNMISITFNNGKFTVELGENDMFFVVAQDERLSVAYQKAKDKLHNTL